MSGHEHGPINMHRHHHRDSGQRTPSGHVVYERIPNTGYGPAFEYVSEREDGSLWIDNSEYSSPVNFCPVCGFKATKQVSYEQG